MWVTACLKVDVVLFQRAHRIDGNLYIALSSKDAVPVFQKNLQRIRSSGDYGGGEAQCGNGGDFSIRQTNVNKGRSPSQDSGISNFLIPLEEMT